jgi:ABC-type transporter Mla maintaining outer membrane lipid asymmetry ATPase subunit MlaF
VAHDPDLLIIEHAFMGQSPLNIRSFMDVLKKRVESPDKSVIFVTYEPQKFLDFADTFYMLYGGRIVFSGARREFLESDNPYLAQYRNISLAGPMDIL